jgi:hypothetical protein
MPVYSKGSYRPRPSKRNPGHAPKYEAPIPVTPKSGHAAGGLVAGADRVGLTPRVPQKAAEGSPWFSSMSDTPERERP